MKILICITELNYILKYINYVLYMCIYIYIYIYKKPLTRRRLKTPHMTATEHLNI